MNNTEEMEHYKSHFSSIIHSLIHPHTIFTLRISYHRDIATHLCQSAAFVVNLS